MSDHEGTTKLAGGASESNEGLGINRQGNVVLCTAFGETDRPTVFAATSREEVQQFIVSEWLGAEDSKNADGSLALPTILAELDAHDWNDGSLKWEFEIGGFGIEDVFMTPKSIVGACGTADGNSAKVCSDAFEWLRHEATKDGASPHAGVALDEWHALATYYVTTRGAA